MNHFEQQQPNKVLKDYSVMTPEGEKHYEVLREERPDGTFECTMEEIVEPNGIVGWKEVPLGRCKILRRYDGENGEKLRDVVYEKAVTGISPQRPTEEDVFFYKATQREAAKDEWEIVPGTEKRIDDAGKEIM